MLRAIGDVLKGMVGKMKGVKEKMDKEEAEQMLLEKWKSKLEDAMQDHNGFRAQCAINDEQYNNSKSVSSGRSTGRVSSPAGDTQTTKDARQVIGLTFQLIESQIDISIPSPRVDELEEVDGERKKMVEGQLKHFSESDELKVIVSENERIAKKNSYAIMKVCYDPNYDGHTYRGKIEIRNPHPNNVVFQKNVYKIEKMNHMWHIENRNIDEVCLEYGEEFRDMLELDGAEYNYLEDFSALTFRESTNNDMISVIECWYKDKEGDVNVLTWANDTILRHEKKFFYKKDLVVGENGKHYETVAMEQYDEQGNIIGYQDVQVIAKIPKDFPFAIHYNIPKEKSIRGKADPEIIFDQQEAIKKVMSNEEERLIRGNTKVFVRKGSGLANKINNSITQIIETDNPTADIYVVDMKTQDRSLKEYYDLMVTAAKDSLGVTDAGQGIINSGQLSGRAIEKLSDNSTGRLAPKMFQKHIAFSQIYRKCFDFMVAFYDDKRPYKFGEGQSKVYGYFNKSSLIKQDSAGEYYYPDFDIGITTDSGIPKDARFMLDFINNAGDRMDNVEYWTVAENLGIQGASDILEMEKQKQEMMIEQQQAEQEMAQQEIMQKQGMPPQQATGQPEAPPQQAMEQPDIIDQVLAGLTPEELQAVEANPELLQQIIQQVTGGGQGG